VRVCFFFTLLSFLFILFPPSPPPPPPPPPPRESMHTRRARGSRNVLIRSSSGMRARLREFLARQVLSGGTVISVFSQIAKNRGDDRRAFTLTSSLRAFAAINDDEFGSEKSSAFESLLRIPEIAREATWINLELS